MMPGIMRVCLLICAFTGISSLREVIVSIPTYRRVGESANLVCEYDLEGEGLYSVKWFKDGVEFYRFMPRSLPPKLVFNDVPGVHVNVEGSDDRLVRLEMVNTDSTGLYYCEVSGEAPSFRTESGGGTLVVVDLPSEDPLISGQSEVYQPDSVISLNCTSEPSKPAARLMWFINDQQVEARHLRPHPIIEHTDGLESSILGIRMSIQPRLFRAGVMRLTCAAYIQAYNYARGSLHVIADQNHMQHRIVQQRQASFLVRSSCSDISMNGAVWLSAALVLSVSWSLLH